jgi:hypothetical protein
VVVALLLVAAIIFLKDPMEAVYSTLTLILLTPIAFWMWNSLAESQAAWRSLMCGKNRHFKGDWIGSPPHENCVLRLSGACCIAD